MQWMLLQQELAEDFVIATGKHASIREFVRMSASVLEEASHRVSASKP